MESLAQAVLALTRECGLDPNFQACGIDEKAWMAKLDEVATLAYEDQYSPANPRMPIVEDMKKILVDAYKGN